MSEKQDHEHVEPVNSSALPVGPAVANAVDWKAVVGLAGVAVALVIGLVGLGGYLDGDSANTAAQQPSAVQAPQPVVQSQQQRQIEEDERILAAEEQSAREANERKQKAISDEQEKWNRTHPDPAPPVSMDKVSGIWWYDEYAMNKAYIFVENSDGNTVDGSLPDGRRLTIRCAVSNSIHDSTPEWPPHCMGLPFHFHAWVRVSIGGVQQAGSRAPAKGWALVWHDGDVLEHYVVQEFCDPDCTLLSQKIQEDSDDDANRRRRGE